MTEQLTAADVLERAADLIEKPGAWTQEASARSKKGNWVDVTGRAAVCWCAAGAIGRVAKDPIPANAAINALADVVGSHFVVTWNDAPERTQAEVVGAMRKAAALARAEAA